MTAPCDLGAAKARRLIGERELSPVELLESCIQRIAAVNGTVNAFVTTCYRRAREEACAAERAVLRRDAIGPLHGLPIGIKDNTNTEGVRTTYGSPLYARHVPDHDARVVAAVRRAGAIVVGKTNVPEFSAGANTTNEVYGPTRNPFDPRLTCGGSSGGSAVALATGMVPLCSGTDSGGSLRVPAAFCGVVAHRGTPGLVPSDSRPVLLTMSHVIGPMARNVTDVALLLSAMAGADAIDPLSTQVHGAGLRTVPDVDLGTLSVATSEDLGFAPVDNGVRREFRQRLDTFAGVFRECIDAAPAMESAFEVFWTLRGVDFVAAHAERYNTSRDRLGQHVRSNIEAGLAMTGKEIGWASAAHAELYREFQRFFKAYDILLCPAVAVPPFAIDQDYCDAINDQPLGNYIEWLSLNSALTLTGHPVCVIPCGVDAHGLPFGLQICGRHRADRMVLGVALALERLFATSPDLDRPVPDVSRLRWGVVSSFPTNH